MHSTIVGVFREQSANRGEAPFLHHWRESGWESLSWAECGRRVLRIGGGLVAAGLEPGQAVLLVSANRVEWILADLGIQAAGGVTVPVYPSSTRDTISKIVANCGARVAIVGSPELAVKLPDGVRVVQVDGELSGWMESDPPSSAAEEVARRIAAIEPSTVASIIYTSGTTGDPKGVVLTNANFFESARGALEHFAVAPEDSLLSFLPYSHVFERESGIYTAIVSGADMWLSRGLDRLAEDIAEVNPTVMLGVPRMFEKIVERIRGEVRKQPGWKRLLFESAQAGRLGPLGAAVLKPVRLRVGGRRLRFFISGGSPLSPDVEAFFWALGIPIYNGWGMTETTSGATANTPHAHRYGTVGKPLPGVELRIAEDGELLVRGPGVMQGYSNDRRATDEVFRDGWLLTGDIGEIDPDGFLRITDRKKDLMKTSGGKFVAPQPIEAKLQSTSYIETALLVGDGRAYLTALLVPRWDRLRSDLGLTETPERLTTDRRVVGAIQKLVDQINSGLGHWETIKYFRLLPRDFEESEEERTPSLKIKRSAVTRKHAELIDQMYEEGQKNRTGQNMV